MRISGDTNLKNDALDSQFRKIFLEVLSGAAPTSVVVAPPGSGKSTQARIALAGLLQEGHLQRVIWMTHSTIDRDGAPSLAAEAARHLTELHIPVGIILGREALGKTAGADRRTLGADGFRERYEAQFRWPPGPSVKLLSHAHLRVLYGRDGQPGTPPPWRRAPLTGPAAAQLLIIDEDPTSSLIESSPPPPSPLSYLRLRARPPATPLARVLLPLMSQVLAHPADPRFRRIGRAGPNVRCSWSGASFNRAVLEALAGESLDRLVMRDRFPHHPGWSAARLMSILLEHPGTSSVGLSWQAPLRAPDRCLTEATLTFRSDLLCALTDLPPTVLLDAYGDRYDTGDSCSYYRGLLGREVRVVPLAVSTARPRLEVSHAPHLRIDRAAVDRALRSGPGQARALLRLDTVTRRIVAFTETQDTARTLVLCYKNMIPALEASLGRVLEERQRTGPLAAAPPEISFQHYFAGRGKNAHTGKHVVAVTEPHQPRQYAEHTLAALYPADPERRRDLARRHRDVELLQALHRSRQLNHAPGNCGAPRILLSFPPPEGLTRDLGTVNLTPAEARSVGRGRPFPSNRTLAWERALLAAATDLSELLNGIPVLALMALGLLEVPDSYQRLVEHAGRRLSGKIRTDRYPHLSRWKVNRAYFRSGLSDSLSAVGTALRPRRSDDRAMLERGLTELLRQRGYSYVQPGGPFRQACRQGQLGVTVTRPSRLRVWARDEVQAGEILVRLLT
ncbi:hypothetical protein ACFQDE_19250 [Deinococcus caeni]|uniref:Uncharacterized protein n=1 Tax=Deinococcus caeni TaxID=569127 RepID=A0ABP9UIL0_9DEIO